MNHRTLYIGSPAFLSIKQSVLELIQKETGEIRLFAPQELALIELDHPQIVMTIEALQACIREGVAIIICDKKHHPAGITLPMFAHSLAYSRQQAQYEASPKRKEIAWRQVLTEKLKNQALVLYAEQKSALYIEQLIRKTERKEWQGAEALAARYYWQELFGSDFRRITRNYSAGEPATYYETPNSPREEHLVRVNTFLNYTYSILRAMMARAIVKAGLNPSFGIFHSNQYNPYPLADDLMEPYRPFCDRHVYLYCMESDAPLTLNRASKAELLRIVKINVWQNGEHRILPLATEETAISFYRFLIQETKQIVFPQIIA